MSLVHKLEYRALKLQAVRQFFHERDYLEIDPTALNAYADPNPYIQPIETKCNRFLHTSPELEMKKILSQIKRDCYFLGHVFRHEEVGAFHTEEFTMIEFYKTETNKQDFLQEVIELIHLFIKPNNVHEIPFDTAFKRFVPKDYDKDPEIQHLSSKEKRDWAWAIYVEKNLNDLTIITDFAKEDACLSTINEKGKANRFEFYYNGIELANAFHELIDPDEQKARFEKDNLLRNKLKLKTIPIDPAFIQSLSSIPKNTFGIALGFDRMVNIGLSRVAQNNIISKTTTSF